jgi:alpha-beta hydrolase superfamily lysophospholipase
MNKKILMLMFLLSAYLLGCQQINDLLPKQQSEQQMNYAGDYTATKRSTGTFITQDNKEIAYTLYENSAAKFGIVLLHMLDRDRNDWGDFAKLLQTAGYSVLAIDLRGHGESTKNWRWRAFSDRDFQAMSFDAKAAVNFFAQKKMTNIVLIGASIGANIALNYGIAEDSVKAIVLLSPGLDYRSVRTPESAEKNTKPTLVIASEDDLYAFTSAQQIYSTSKSSIKDYQYYKNAGHGTDIFKKEKAGLHIIDWLARLK